MEITLHEGLVKEGSAQVKVRAPGGSRVRPEQADAAVRPHPPRLVPNRRKNSQW